MGAGVGPLKKERSAPADKSLEGELTLAKARGRLEGLSAAPCSARDKAHAQEAEMPSALCHGGLCLGSPGSDRERLRNASPLSGARHWVFCRGCKIAAHALEINQEARMRPSCSSTGAGRLARAIIWALQELALQKKISARAFSAWAKYAPSDRLRNISSLKGLIYLGWLARKDWFIFRGRKNRCAG